MCMEQHDVLVIQPQSYNDVTVSTVLEIQELLRSKFNSKGSIAKFDIDKGLHIPIVTGLDANDAKKFVKKAAKVKKDKHHPWTALSYPNEVFGRISLPISIDELKSYNVDVNALFDVIKTQLNTNINKTDERWATVYGTFSEIKTARAIVLRHIVESKRRQEFTAEQLIGNKMALCVQYDDANDDMSHKECIKVLYALWYYFVMKSKLKYHGKCGFKLLIDDNFTGEVTILFSGSAKDVRNCIDEVRSTVCETDLANFKQSEIDLSLFGNLEAQHVICKSVERHCDACIVPPLNNLEQSVLIAPKYQHKVADDYINFLKSSIPEKTLTTTEILQSNEAIVMQINSNLFLPIVIIKTDELHFVSQSGQRHIVIVKGDIIKQQVDAIVNAANDHLGNGGGVAKIIANAAGEELKNQCFKVMNERGWKGLEVTTAVCTTGGKLCKYVIHVVGPDYIKYRGDYENCLKLLSKAFFNCFKLAISLNNVRSIALPAVSSGIFGFPKEIVADAMVQSIDELLHTQEINRLSDIRFVMIDEAIFKEAKRKFYMYLLSSMRAPNENNTSAEESFGNASNNNEIVLPIDPKEDMKSLKTSDSIGQEKKNEVKKNDIIEENDENRLHPDRHTNSHSYTNTDKETLFNLKEDNSDPSEHCTESTKLDHSGHTNRLKNNTDHSSLNVTHLNSKYDVKFDNPDSVTGGRYTEEGNLIAEGKHKVIDGRSKEERRHEAPEKSREVTEERHEFTDEKYEVTNENHEVVGEKCAVTDDRREVTDEKIDGTNEKPEVFDENHEFITKRLEKLQNTDDGHLQTAAKGELLYPGTNHSANSYMEVVKTVDILKASNVSVHLKDTEGLKVDNSNEHNDSTEPLLSISNVDLNAKDNTECNGCTKNVDHSNVKSDVSNKAGAFKAVVEITEVSTAKDVKTDQNSRDICLICMDEVVDAKRLLCNHVFCTLCIDQSFALYQPKCPSCGKMYGILKGNQPDGQMIHKKIKSKLPGYETVGTIEIQYLFNNGIQEANHPNPGRAYTGTYRKAYLPDNPEGRKVLRLLEKAFAAKLTFTIGTSVTTGQSDMVIWNDIHHKTVMRGDSYGYPDPTYLKRVTEELALKGIVDDDAASK